MSSKAAILGLGERGRAWAGMFRDAGWRVSGFDPDPSAMGLPTGSRGWRREQTISSTVAYADWVICCVPDRLELMQKIIQRAQAEAADAAVIAVTSRLHDVDAVQGCAIRPAQVVLITHAPAGGVELNLTSRNQPDLKVAALAVLSEVCPADLPPEGSASGVLQSRESKSA
ncbi:hypothetical protein [Silicimonas sp. MF1-12-2]|uniref:hypothetical protein n=1 Tax=Silicimonas sp. MF1-12-2 TaxID=3384793 RepID=UPI0039B4AD00